MCYSAAAIIGMYVFIIWILRALIIVLPRGSPLRSYSVYCRYVLAISGPIAQVHMPYFGEIKTSGGLDTALHVIVYIYVLPWM